MEKIVDFLREFGVLIIVGVVGSGILIFGLWGVMGERATVEIVKGGSQPVRSDLVGSENDLQPTRSDLLITVDVAGAVQKPGVYKLPNGSRIGDALVMAGGLGEKADREWVSKTINLAEVVKDGGKIYLPVYKETPSQIESKGVSLGGQGVTLGITSKKININTASLSELDSLVGIGEVRARTIMDNRPYSDTNDLVTKAKIPQSVYEKIKDLVTVY